MPALPLASGAVWVELQVGLLPLQLAGAHSHGLQYSQQRPSLLLNPGVPHGWSVVAVRMGSSEARRMAAIRAGVVAEREEDVCEVLSTASLGTWNSWPEAPGGRTVLTTL